jgi:SAM-dependent methyltransferase
MNQFHEANRRGWDAVSPMWQTGIEAQGRWRRCHREPQLALAEEELRFLRDVAGKAVCVLGSGDNLVVFALAGLGAQVTSVDISQAQLDTAARRAGELGLSIRFVRADVTDLSDLSDETFDLVYTGGHVAVWISNLALYYREACRILERGGLFLVSEYHPFRRIWKCDTERLEREFGYFDRGPIQYDRADQTGGAVAGPLPCYEFHWTVGDYVAALLDAGCELLSLQEFGQGRQGWETAPLEGLPESLLLVGRKRT